MLLGVRWWYLASHRHLPLAQAQVQLLVRAVRHLAVLLEELRGQEGLVPDFVLSV